MNIFTMNKSLFVVAAVLILVIPFASASESKGTGQTSHALSGYIDSRYMQLLDTYANPVVADREAAYLRNLYEALIKKGFSKDEALKIVIEHDSPLAGSLR